MIARWRRWCVAAIEAGVGLGLVDAAIAMGRSGERLASKRDRLFFVLSLAGISALGLVVLTCAAVAVTALFARLRPSLRPLAAQVLAVTVGIAGGFALFSGTAMRRSPARPWAILATAALAALVAQFAWSKRGQVADAVAARPSATQAALLFTSALLYLANAFLYVRLYPGLHAIAAIGSVASLIAALAIGIREVTQPTALVMAVALVAGGLGSASLLRSQSQRALARQRAPVSGYFVVVLGRILPHERVVGVSRDDRFVAGQHLDLRGADLVLVTVDALRADAVGAYGNARRLTPTIDAMASHGVLVERVYCATPHTSYSIASLMTSKYIRQLSLLGPPSRAHETLAGMLATVGYATAAFYPPAVFSVDAERIGDLHDRGFDFEYRRENYSDASTRVREVAQFLNTVNPARRVFVWVHLFEPHEPYESHASGRCCHGGDVRERYDGEVAAVDDAIATLRAEFERHNRRPVWIVTADHGEEFGEHGGRFHGTTLYDEQVRVPLVIEGPRIPVAERVGPANLVDVMPTVLAGVGIPRPARLRGRDLGALVFGERWEHPVFASTGSSRMVIDASEKLICDVSDGSCELFDLARDPTERMNLADARPTRLATLRSLLAEWEGSHGRYEREVQDAGNPIAPTLERALQGDATVRTELAGALDGADDATAKRIAFALANLGVREPAVIEPLARLAARPEAETAREGGMALALLGDRRGESAARQAAQSSDVVTARRGALGLARIGIPDGVAVLARWVTERGVPDAERDRAVAALEQLRDGRAYDAWIALLDDPRLAPRAARALGLLGNRAAVDPLARVADTTRYALTRRAALMALASLDAAQARRRFADALGLPDALPDPFPLAAALGEPGHLVLGALSVVRSRVDGGRSTVPLRGPHARGTVFVFVRTQSAHAQDIRIGAETVRISARASDVRVQLDGIGSTLTFAAPEPLEVRGVLVAPQGGSSR